ncbi:TPA: transporter substrate-binding domain-containing protein [Streptococcus pneumoniae]|nr:transporter substrate-binding domain-containing protein [Streptococcus pneumoniae]
MRKIYLSIFTSLLLMLGLVNVAQADEYLRIGMEAAYAPFNWTQDDDSNGAVKIDGTNQYANGYDVQIAKKIAKDLGKEPLVVKTKWEGLVPALTSGKIDMIIAGMSPTAERKQEIAFSSSYYTSEPVLLVKKDSAYASAKSLDDFNGAKITSQQGVYLYDLIAQIPGAKKETAMGDFAQMRQALEAGVIDAYVSERPEALTAEAATALGMTHNQTMRKIVLPQVVRNILPATGNEFVINIKDTSVLNVISVVELYFSGNTVATQTYQYFQTFTIIAVIYFVLTFTVTRILRFIERRMDMDTYTTGANQMQTEDLK